ncbi:T9SS type A sorting domain-containing protein, partial [Flavobacterium sp.]
SIGLKAQIVTIPDANFKAKLLQADVTNEIAKDANDNKIKIDINGNGEIEVSEALLVSKLFYTSASSGGPPPFKNQNSVQSQPFTDLTGISAFANLTYLDVSVNQLTTLDASNNLMLNHLICSANLLTSVNVSGLTNLKSLILTNNDLTSLDTSTLTSLNNLDCRGNAIPDLNLTLNTQLKYLDCSDNLLTALNLSSCTQLTNLQCSYNQIGTLTVNAPATLLRFYCYQNQITSAIDLNNYSVLEYFDCDTNQITSLSFGNNNHLVRVWCADNNISTLDFSGTTLYRLSCGNNPNLTYLNVKNGVVTPDLYVSAFPEPPFVEDCFKLLNTPALQYICYDEGEFGTTLVTNEGLENVSRGTYCSFQPGGSFNTVNGTVTLDCGGANIPFFNQKINITAGTQSGYSYTNTSGNYSFYTGTGAVTVAPQLENSTYFTISPANYSYNFATTGNSETANFCLSANGTHPDLEVTILPINPARPGFHAKYKIVFKNKGNQVQDGTLSFTFDDAVLDFVSATPVMSSSAGNTLYWDFTNLLPFESREIMLTLNLNSPVETPPVNIGDILQYTLALSTSQTDETPADNSLNYNQTVVGPYDPNDKTVVEGAEIGSSQTGDYLHYIIRFQNMGTAAAENVVVKDMLDANLDWSTLEMVSSSHLFRSTLTSGNKLEVFYEGINLPPSSADEAGSQGYIAFKIKPKNTIAINEVITNTAGIYFDFNFPVTTNTVTTTVTALGTPVFNQGKLFVVYPNPARNQINITIPNGMVESVTICNTLGQNVINAENVQTIDVSLLTQGTYFITVETDRGRATEKIIKL